MFDSENGNGYQFYPGTGGSDDYVHNVINVPIAPLWKFPKANERRNRAVVQQVQEKEKDVFHHPSTKRHTPNDAFPDVGYFIVESSISLSTASSSRLVLFVVEMLFGRR